MRRCGREKLRQNSLDMKTKYVFLAGLGALALFCFLLLSNAPAVPEKTAGMPADTPQRDTCDDSDANPRCCFRDMPQQLTADMVIAGPGEPGERLAVRGYVYQADGKTPYPNVLLYAYHTDKRGIYAKKGDETGIRRWHGRLHGWCRTDERGHYSISTIKPASYPDSRNPAHIHVVVQEPDGSEPYYINDMVFSDDPYVDERYRAGEKRGKGGSGILKLVKDRQGLWESKRLIVLE